MTEEAPQLTTLPAASAGSAPLQDVLLSHGDAGRPSPPEEGEGHLDERTVIQLLCERYCTVESSAVTVARSAPLRDVLLSHGDAERPSPPEEGEGHLDKRTVIQLLSIN
ncbi:hypothetical protein INR49_023236 [Caranx melampygus]|nr:hypothetical protein INR49_023236 [Caranx melampygus]